MTNAGKVNNLIMAMFSVFTCLALSKFIFGTKNALLTISILEVAKSKFDKKNQNFIWLNAERQTAPCESTAEQVSFEWSHQRISSTDSKARSNMQDSIVNSLWSKRVTSSCIKNIKI